MPANARGAHAIEIAQLVCAIVLTVGVCTFAAPCACEATEEGGCMACHWAGRALLGIGAAATAVCVARELAPRADVRTGIGIATVALGALAALTPGVLIDLCMMATMRCNAVMRPFAVVAGIAIAAAGIAATVIRNRAANGA